VEHRSLTALREKLMKVVPDGRNITFRLAEIAAGSSRLTAECPPLGLT